MENASGLRPVEYQVIVELDAAEKKTPGGIILLDNTKERDKLAVQEGRLVAKSPLAFNYANDWPEGSIPEVGQRVMFRKFEGSIFERKDGDIARSFRLLSDKSIIAIVEE